MPVVVMKCYAAETQRVVSQCRPGDVIHVSREAEEYLVRTKAARRISVTDGERAYISEEYHP